MIPEIDIKEYNYDLPDERIAKYPLSERDMSKLLVYKDADINEDNFTSIPDHLPEGHLMVFNDTKVVPARLHFQRETGAHIEIFCLEPVLPEEYVSMFAVTDRCRWKCIVGNVKRWKGDTLYLYNPEASEAVSTMNLKADLIERNGETSIVEFSWSDGAPFSAVLELCGSVPIPPYLNRDTESIDLERYQTLYAKFRGSVAAPTAGLHFTDNVLNNLRQKGIQTAEVTLHVGAGTFQPVKVADANQHPMHTEIIAVPRETIETIIANLGHIVAVGTTSMRTLESLYFLGAQLYTLHHTNPSTSSLEERSGVSTLSVTQFEPYEKEHTLSTRDALQAIIDHLEQTNQDILHAETQIMIKPGYAFRIVDQLITNFHQPKSTLLLLVSAFVGGDWHTIYDYALAHNFRFLSYGDSSILTRISKY